MIALTGTVGAAGALLNGSQRGGRLMRSVNGALDSRWLPAACGALAFILDWLLWGSLRQVSVGNDETAYLLQAKIFASGRLVGPGRPLPEFFQQFHVFVQPVLAAKYPPGHSLLLALGVWLGIPGLVPALLVGITASLLCSVTRQFTNGATAVLAVLLATTSDIALRFNPSYFSETTTSALFLIAWWSLLEYRRNGRTRWLVLCAIAVGWGGITRPLTMLAFAVPTSVCALIAIRRHRSWRDIVPAFAAIAAILSFQAVWNWRVVGNWRTMPHAEYARLYTPSDRLGFHSGPAPLPAASRLSPDEQAADQTMRRWQDGYSLATIPAVATARAVMIIRGTWSYGGLPGLAVLFSLSMLPAAIFRVVAGTIVCVFVAYLAWPMDPGWTLYYLELQAPLAFLTAVGICGAVRLLARHASTVWPRMALQRETIQLFGSAAVAVWLTAPTLPRIADYRDAHAEQSEYRARFQRAVAALPPGPSVVFVRYAQGHGEERLVDNVPDLASARTWIVHDLGTENTRLLTLAPHRTPYVYRETLTGDHLEFRIERLLPTQPAPIAESRARRGHD